MTAYSPLLLVIWLSVLIRLWAHYFPILYTYFSCNFPHTESLCLTLPTQCPFILQAHLISSVYSNHSPSVLLTDSSTPEFLYELTTSNYLALNNFLLILSHCCLIGGLLILFTKLLLPLENMPHSVRSVQMRSMYMRHIRISFVLLYLFFLV